MRYQFYREHKYVSSALNNLERLIAKADFCDVEDLKKVEENFEDLAGMLKGHAEYENKRLHALLKQKNVSKSFYEHIEEGHVVQERQLVEIEKIIKEIARESESQKKIKKGSNLYLLYRKFVADNLDHLHEEEIVILPELQKLYSDSELQQVEAKSYKEMTPQEIVQMIQILFPHMNVYDQEAFLSDIFELEPEKFKVVWEVVQSTLGENRSKLVLNLFS